MFMFLHSTLQNERFWPEWQQGFPKFNLLLLSSRMSGPEVHPASCTMGAKSIKITLDCKKENGRHPSNWCTIKKNNGHQDSPGGKSAAAWHRPPAQTSDEVNERVELYLYSSSVPSWYVIVRTLPFLFMNAVSYYCSKMSFSKDMSTILC
jgi:hypothetical protein